MTIENDLYMLIYQKLKKLGYRVYIGNPEEDVEYPFVFIGEQLIEGNRSHKEYSDKDISITVHVWHNSVYERGTLFRVIENIEYVLEEELGVKGEDIGVRVLGDPEDLSLLHGVVEVKIKNIKESV